MPTNFKEPRTVEKVSVHSVQVTENQALTAVYRMGLSANDASLRGHVAALAMIYASCFEGFQPFDVELESIHELVNQGYIKAQIGAASAKITVLPVIL